MDYHYIKQEFEQHSLVYLYVWMTKFQDWVFFMTSSDLFEQDDSCPESFTLDLEGIGIGIIIVSLSAKRKRMKIGHAKIACSTAV